MNEEPLFFSKNQQGQPHQFDEIYTTFSDREFEAHYGDGLPFFWHLMVHQFQMSEGGAMGLTNDDPAIKLEGKSFCRCGV
jgi:hypothetical protein